MATAREVRDLLEERPDLEPALEAVMEPEAPWTFQDVDVDSGEFGELVSRGVVERDGGGYRVPDRAAVERAIAGDVEPEGRRPELTLPSLPVSRLEVALLLGAVALVVAFRLFPLPNVYHAGHVVLSSNDPYYYRYLVEQLLSNPDVTPGSLPFEINRSEPLFVVALWLATVALGGTAAAAGHVMAWYPVASAAVAALLLYALAVVVTDDRRIGLAAVLVLAVIPGHAFRTSLGFADHHAFDYPWLVLAVLAVALIARGARRGTSPRSRATVAGTVGLAVAVAGQTLAWDNSPLLLVALGGYIALDALRAVRAGSPPWRTGGPVAVGVAAGTALVWVAHLTLGWHTTLVATAPVLLTAGVVGVVGAAEAVRRLDLPAVALPTAGAVGLVVGTLAVRALLPGFWARLGTSIDRGLFAERAIAETSGLFAQSGGWLTLLGFALFLGVPYLVWASGRAFEDGRWLPPATYAWYFLLLSVLQVRFVGELAPFLALFAGLGLVHLAERIDVARRPAPFADGEPPGLVLPERGQLGALLVLFMLVGSLGIVQVPVKTGQVVVPQAQSDAALWMADYSEEHGMEYPANQVLSEWGWSRMYNYFVNGEARSYGLSQTNFQAFVSSTDPEGWYGRFSGRTGFVVTTPDAVGEPSQIGTRLHRYNGSATTEAPGLGHYRLVHVTGGSQYKVFTPVPGAVINGTTQPGATVTAVTTVDVSGTSFQYARRTTTGPNGTFELRVAYPGEYRLGGGFTVDVPESAVTNGSTVQIDRPG